MTNEDKKMIPLHVVDARIKSIENEWDRVTKQMYSGELDLSKLNSNQKYVLGASAAIVEELKDLKKEAILVQSSKALEPLSSDGCQYPLEPCTCERPEGNKTLEQRIQELIKKLEDAESPYDTEFHYYEDDAVKEVIDELRKLLPK